MLPSFKATSCYERTSTPLLGNYMGNIFKPGVTVRMSGSPPANDPTVEKNNDIPFWILAIGLGTIAYLILASEMRG